MKAENKLHLVKLLFLAALATGCIAQAAPAPGTDDPGSSDQALTQTGATAVASPQEKRAVLGTEQRADTKSGFTTTTVLGKGENLESVDFANPTDPGGPVTDDGDGREPDPHPWHSRTAALAR